MPRARTGTLVYKRTTGWNARIWVDVRDAAGTATQERRWVPLGTHDKDLAKRKLAKVVAMLGSGELAADAAPTKAKAVETVREAAASFIVVRKAARVVMASDEERWLDKYALQAIGALPVTQVRPRDIKVILNDAKPVLSHESLKKLRGTLDRLFNWLWQAEIIAENPVKRTVVPSDARVDERPRMLLTDAQLLVFLNGRASGPDGTKPRADSERRLLEVKVMAVCSRVLGGLRTAEVNRWTWDMLIDPDAEVQTFERVKVRRAKAKRGHAGKVQPFLVPEPMRHILATWHELHDKPTTGPVFPVTKGKRTGEHRLERATSYAHRLRRELWRIGIRDHALHNDTATTKRVDWHSFRRSFATSLAEAGVNEQRAMMLTSHSDSKVHARYVQETQAMQAIPEASVPLLPASLATGKVTAVTKRSPRCSQTAVFRHARCDSNTRHSASKADTLSS